MAHPDRGFTGKRGLHRKEPNLDFSILWTTPGPLACKDTKSLTSITSNLDFLFLGGFDVSLRGNSVVPKPTAWLLELSGIVSWFCCKASCLVSSCLISAFGGGGGFPDKTLLLELDSVEGIEICRFLMERKIIVY